METTFIFVYGTLMTGFRNYDKFLRGRVLSSQRAYVKGSLYHLFQMDCPAYVEAGDNKVYGEILEIPADRSLITALDELEESTNQDDRLNTYIKKGILVFTEEGKAFASLPTYVYNLDSASAETEAKVLVTGGNWKQYRQDQSI